MTKFTSIPVRTRIGRLIIVRQDGFLPSGKKRQTAYLCQCACGNLCRRTLHALSYNKTQSCGCFSKERVSETHFVHGEIRTQLYAAWASMKQRCTNILLVGFYRYGGRGITFCDEWKEYTNFSKWAKANGYEQGLTLDRVDVDGNYEPSNCQWIPWLENKQKDRKIRYLEAFGERKTLVEWALDSRCKVGYRSLLTRVIGWDVTPEEMITLSRLKKGERAEMMKNR